jgi:prepilin-type processing-associated H-X9-DG protein
MQDNLVGYVLNALDPDTLRKVEDYLRARPEVRGEVDLLRQALEPLAADRVEIEPPPGLAVRTLATVAEYCCRELPRAPRTVSRWSDVPHGRWWRRADVLVAACLLLTIGLLIPPVVNNLRARQQLERCRNNLNQFGEALIKYSQIRGHQKRFPNLDDPDLGSRNVAGAVVPMLVSAGCLDPNSVTVRCPGVGAPMQCPLTVEQVIKLKQMEFDRRAPRFLCCYAYSLGYLNQGRIESYSYDHFPVPIMADRPPFRGERERGPEANSPNHGGQGQNLLFSDGHVAFLTGRTFQGDDIYLNRDNQVGAGKDAEDIVLGLSEARPQR